MLRSIGAVIVGFVVMAIIVTVGTMRLAAMLVPGGIAGMQSKQAGAVVPRGYLVANLVLSLLAAIFGGWLTVRIAGSAPAAHAGALAALVLAMGLLSAGQAGGAGNHSGQPSWYPWVITAVGAGGALIGGMVRP